MDVLFLNLTFLFFYLCQSASIHKKNETLETFKNDVSQVGSAIENFTFDILREIIEDSEDEETTTVKSARKRRSAEDEVRQLCQKRCQATQNIETQQIKELTLEVKKLKELVKLLQDQQKILDVLDERNNTRTEKETRQEAERNEEVPNNEQLVKIKNDLKEVINNLNETRELIDLQQQKDVVMETELMRQKDEITKLKSVVAEIIHKNVTNEENKVPFHPSARSSDFSSIKKLLKSLPEDDDEDGDIHAKLLQLQKEIKKKRRQQTLFNELKTLEKNLNSEEAGDSDLLKQIIKAIKRTEPQAKSDSLEVTSLSDLEEAINRLRPKESESSQFQAVLNKLINQRPSQIKITPQQMNELTKKLTPNNYPPICIVDDGGVKSKGYRNLQFYPPPPPQQFFPGQFTQPSYFAQGNVNGASPEKPLNYQAENGDYNRKYQEDLKQQIDGLQGAIDSLNRPEYVQRPEDKVIVDDLERQIGDLRNIVDNLNYESVRNKRSTENNEVEDGEKVVKKMTDFVDSLLKEDDGQKKRLEDIQTRINSIKNQLGGNSKERTSEYIPPSYTELMNPTAKEVKSNFKKDFFIDVLSKIIDKIISAIPVVIQKLFSFSLDELSKNDYSDYDIQTLYKNLGIFAYLPVIILRLVKGIGAFMNMLRKSSFFKNFLMPALILGTVAGSVLFLIWWLQPDEAPNTSYDPYDQNYNQNYNQYPPSSSSSSSNNYVYNRSYFNK